MDLDDWSEKITLDITEAHGIDALLKQLAQVEKEAKAAGLSIREIEEVQRRFLYRNKDYRGGSASGELNARGEAIFIQYQRETRNRDLAQRQRDDMQRRQQYQRLTGLANPFAFLNPKTGVNVQGLLNSVGRVVPRVQSLAAVFQTTKGVWDFAEGIAKLNTHLLQLGYTSGLGAQKLTDLGAAVAAFGGSVDKVAAGNERFIMQIEKMKRGGGMGYLADVAYKYGFSVDLNADWETNNEKAIAHARQMIANGDKNGAMAFLKEMDPKNYESNMARAKKSASEDAEYQSFFKKYDELGDADKVTEETQKFNEESAKAQRAWTAITNQLASMLLPLMTKLTSFVTKIADAMAKSPGLLKTMLIILGAMAGALTGLIAKQLISTTLAIMKATAIGNWAGAATALAIGAGIGVSLAGGALVASGGETTKGNKVDSVAENAISVDELYNRSKKLTARESYSLDQMDRKAFGKSFDPEWNDRVLQDETVNLATVFASLGVVCEKTRESMKDVATEAMSLEHAQKMATILATANNVSNVANSNTTNSNVNVQVSQTFNEADTSTIKAGIYDLNSELANAARRFT